VCIAAIHDRYLPDTQLLQRLHHRIHHGNHLYTDVGLIDSDSVLQVHSSLHFSIRLALSVFIQAEPEGDEGMYPPPPPDVQQFLSMKNTATYYLT